MKRQNLISILGSLLCSSMLFSQTIFRDNCQELRKWQFLDVIGDGKVQIVEDLSVPSGYGPKVIEMTGTNILLFAKQVQMGDGTLLVLWKDVDPNHADSDGIVLFRADYPSDLSQIHDLKKNRPHYWFEQDYDSGILIRYRDENDKEYTLTERPGIGLVQDKSWNCTGWFWQKVRCEGEKIQAKFWSVVESEPEHWLLQTNHAGRLKGRFGIRGWSACARIAYFEASSNAISLAVPAAYLHANYTLVFDEQPISFKLFTNIPDAIPNASLKLTVLSGQKILGEHLAKFPIKAGLQKKSIALKIGESQVDEPALAFRVPEALHEGRYKFEVSLTTGDADNEIAETSRQIEIISAKEIRRRLTTVNAAQQVLAADAIRLKAQAGQWRAKQVAAKTAKMMLNLAEERLASHNQAGAGHVIDLAEAALQRATNFPTAYLHTPGYALKFVDVQLSSESWREGETDTVTVFWQVSGEKPDRDLTMTFSLVDEYNQVITAVESQPEIPTSQWEPGKIVPQKFWLTVPSELPDPPNEPIEMAKVFAGNYYLTVTVHGPREKDTSKKEIFLLDNSERQAFFPVGKQYILREIYISPANVQIKAIKLPKLKILEEGTIQVKLQNFHIYPEKVRCVLQIQTAATLIHEDVKELKLHAQSYTWCNFSWKANYVGDLWCVIKIVQNNQLESQSIREWKITWPDDIRINIRRENHVEVKDDEFSVPLILNIERPGATFSARVLDLRVYAGANEYLHEIKKLSTKSENEKWVISIWPYWGYYRVVGKITSGSQSFHFEKRLIATVVETQGMEILVNGEPFIVKGVNVHSLYPQSRRLSDQAMKILKAHGFNMLRGDYPPRWEIQMAEENNLCWMLLPEFSCTSTESIYSRYEADALGAVQGIIRQYVLANREFAGVLFWNSCNEITHHLDEFLLHLYAEFKIYDPYDRPVIYANLHGQDNWRGQDIMGVNYYFSVGQRALSRMPIIEHSIQIAKEHSMPIIFTEYNSWWGPVESTGAEAVEILWNGNLSKGMSGGTLYKMTDVPKRHPGLFDNQNNLRIRNVLSQALIQSHADAEVKIQERQGRQLTLTIINKRNFHLRKISLDVTIRGVQKEYHLGTDIPPKTSIGTAMLLPPELENASFSLIGTLSFETHFGLRNQIPMELYVK